MVCETLKKVESDIFQNTCSGRETSRFTAKELDEETGLYYYGARYLNPRTSRWISSDPAGFDLVNPMDDEGKPRQGFSFIESQNWYSYVSNNPIKYFDPTGFEQRNNITLTFYRDYMSQYSRGNSSWAGKDYAILKNTDTGAAIRIDGIQTYSNHEGYKKKDTIKDFSTIVFKLRKSGMGFGFSLALGNAQTIGGQTTDSDGFLPDSDKPNTGHASRGFGDEQDYAGTIKSGGCFVIPGEGLKSIVDKLKEWGVKVDDTFNGNIQLDLTTIDQ